VFYQYSGSFVKEGVVLLRNIDRHSNRWTDGQRGRFLYTRPKLCLRGCTD